MGKKTIEDRIKAAEEKMKQAKARMQALEAIARKQDRKIRTRRLIQVGGVMASIGIETTEQADRLKEVLLAMATKGDWTKGRVRHVFGGDPPERFVAALGSGEAPVESAKEAAKG